MDVLGLATGTLYAMEQLENKPKGKSKELETQLREGVELLNRIESASQAQTQKFGLKDVFMLRLAEELEKRVDASPSDLGKKVHEAAEELQAGRSSVGALWLFEQISDAAARMTSRSVDAISTSLQ
jgi:hypothetical protein